MADIYLLINGSQEGPYPEHEIRQALAWGFIPSDIPAWRHGEAERLPVGSLMGMPKESKPWVEMYVLKNKLPTSPRSVKRVDDQAARVQNVVKRKTRVLMVDDGVEFTNIVQLTLELKGNYEVRVENNPLSAIATAKTFKPDIILLDVIMPEMDGGEVQRQCMSDPNLKHIPIIFLTATVRQKDVEEHNGIIGGSFYVAKPVSADGLIKTIEERTRP